MVSRSSSPTSWGKRRSRGSGSKAALALLAVLLGGCLGVAFLVDLRRGRGEGRGAERAAPAGEDGASAVGAEALVRPSEEEAQVRASSGGARRRALARVVASDAAAVDVTFVTQASADRAWMLRAICARWPGDVAASILSPRGRTGDVLLEAANACGDGSLRFEADRTAVRSGRLGAAVRFAAASSSSGDTTYPINELRNLALALVRTSHVIVADVDFWPSAELYEAAVQQRLELARDPKAALVVPAFSKKGNRFKTMPMDAWRHVIAAAPNFIPPTFTSMVACLETAECVVFDATWNREAHSTTESSKWLALSAKAMAASTGRAIGVVASSERRPMGKDASAAANTGAPPRLQAIPCFKSRRYEPYVIVRYDEGVLPAYDEAFTGYGKNKIEHVHRLRLSGYRFSVLPLGFLCHCPHPWSSAKKDFVREGRGNHATDALFDRRMRDFEADQLRQRRPANYTKVC